MRTWRVVGKYPILDGNGEVANTAIQLVATAGGEGGFTEVVIGDHTGKPDEELIKLARDAYFKSEYSDRAMAESVVKIDELEQATKEFKDMVAEMRTAIDESKEQTEQNRELVKIVSLTLNEVLVSLYADEEELTDEETTEDTY